VVAEIDWDRTVLTLVAPDALVRHVGGEVVRRMQAEGFTPVAWKPMWRRPSALDAFNERNINEVWKSYLYRLVDRLFAFGPAIALLMRDTAPVDGVSSHDRMRKLKGASQPELVDAGTIRGDLDSTNIMLALMHSSDTPQESAQESVVFTSPGGFSTGEPGDLWTLMRGIELGFPKESRGFEGVVAALRARIVSALWDDLPGPARDLATTLLTGAVADLAAAGTGARLADLFDRPDHPLTAILRDDFAAEAPPDVDLRPVIDIDAAHLILRAHGIRLDPWEDIVLATSLRFPPRRAGY
jgi:nucleoside diphosphate kinase